jgi:hypothetical protein
MTEALLIFAIETERQTDGTWTAKSGNYPGFVGRGWSRAAARADLKRGIAAVQQRDPSTICEAPKREFYFLIHLVMVIFAIVTVICDKADRAWEIVTGQKE